MVSGSRLQRQREAEVSLSRGEHKLYACQVTQLQIEFSRVGQL